MGTAACADRRLPAELPVTARQQFPLRLAVYVYKSSQCAWLNLASFFVPNRWSRSRLRRHMRTYGRTWTYGRTRTAFMILKISIFGDGYNTECDSPHHRPTCSRPLHGKLAKACSTSKPRCTRATHVGLRRPKRKQLSPLVTRTLAANRLPDAAGPTDWRGPPHVCGLLSLIRAGPPALENDLLWSSSNQSNQLQCSLLINSPARLCIRLSVLEYPTGRRPAE